jgi:hypothetical protein
MNLERTILTALGNVHPRQLPNEVLRADVQLMCPGERVPLSEYNKALSALETKGQVVGVTSEDSGTLWKITPAGRARLAE